MSENVPLCPPLCSLERGNKETVFSARKKLKKDTVPPCSPISGTKEIHINNVYQTKKKVYNKAHIGNNREKRGNMGEHLKKTDPRFNSKSFRNSVRIVFEELGLQPTFKNFKIYDPIIDWHALSRSLQYPVFRAKCYVLCGNKNLQPLGTKIETPNGPLTTIINIPASSRVDAIKKLNPNTHKFIEWWT